MIVRRRVKKALPLHTNHRLLFGISINVLIASICAIVGPIAAYDFIPIEGTRGNVQTCKAQGFLFQWFYLGTAMYNGALILYFTLATTSKLSEIDIRRRVEPLMHVLAFFFPLATAIVCLVMDLYNPSVYGLWGCWIASWPPFCRENGESCVRGENHDSFFLAFVLVPLYCLLLCIYVCLAIMYCKARRKARFTRQQSQRQLGITNAGMSIKLLEKMKRQALVYGVVFLFMYLFLIVLSTIATLGGLNSDINLFPVTVLASFFSPIQGILNFVIYVKPRYTRVRKTNTNKSRLWALWKAVALDQISDFRGSSSTENNGSESMKALHASRRSFYHNYHQSQEHTESLQDLEKNEEPSSETTAVNDKHVAWTEANSQRSPAEHTGKNEDDMDSGLA